MMLMLCLSQERLERARLSWERGHEKAAKPVKREHPM